MLLRILLICLYITPIAQPALAAPKPRPFSDEGLLIIRPTPPQANEASCNLEIYREPGVERITDLECSDLPSLDPVIMSRPGEYPVAVTGKKLDWLQIAYDDAGREGWLEISRSWDYWNWSSFLKGRSARLLPGLKKDLYLLRSEPSSGSPQLDTLSRQKSLRIVEIQDDWALVLVDFTSYGWLRWRDNDGRFAISIDDNFDPQKH